MSLSHFPRTHALTNPQLRRKDSHHLPTTRRCSYLPPPRVSHPVHLDHHHNQRDAGQAERRPRPHHLILLPTNGSTQRNRLRGMEQHSWRSRLHGGGQLLARRLLLDSQGVERGCCLRVKYAGYSVSKRYQGTVAPAIQLAE